jgi:hypothetical protein
MSDPTRYSTTIAVRKPLGYPSTSGSDERSDALFDEPCGVHTVGIDVDGRKIGDAQIDERAAAKAVNECKKRDTQQSDRENRQRELQRAKRQ